MLRINYIPFNVIYFLRGLFKDNGKVENEKSSEVKTIKDVHGFNEEDKSRKLQDQKESEREIGIL